MSGLIDNRAHRVRALKEVIRQLNRGRGPAEAKAQLKALLRECDVSEIAAMEQELIAEGVPVAEIVGMRELHSEVGRSILVERPSAPPPPGHPVDTFLRENEALSAQAASLRAAFEALAPQGGDVETPVEPAHLIDCRRVYAGLMDVEKHDQRKEYLVFSSLERHGITGPTTVMWGEDDRARALLTDLGIALAENEGSVGKWRLVAQTVAGPALSAVEEMIFKVERILTDFRSGRRAVAEFWIDFKGRFAHIRYFALRDEKGGYLGTLEVTQDLTHERALQGERRLIEYEV